MEEESRGRGGAMPMVLQEGQRLGISGLSLVDPASAGGQQPVVSVRAEVGRDEAYTIGTLSSETPIVAVPPVELGGEFVLRHDSAAAGVRLYGYVLGPPRPDGAEGPERARCVLTIGAGEAADLDGDGVEEEEDDEEARVEYEPFTEEELAERYDSDNGEDDGAREEEDEPRKFRDGEAAGERSKSNIIPRVAAPAGRVVPDGEFLGPARFAAVENTAGFIRVAAVEAASGQEGKEILVLYRYTRFSRTWSGRRGVEACRRTKLHWLRFAVPPAGDMASSLAWAGSSLGPLIYPGLFRRELQNLWSSLAAAAITTIPPQASRLQVIVDVGILRRVDYTAERMGHMPRALEATTGEAWPEYYHVGMELHLPEPVRLEEEQCESTRPAKRRRIAEEEVAVECSLCFDPLESGLAAWPGCRHVFHGECVEKTLAGREECPLCRHKLSDPLICKKMSDAAES